MLLFSVIAHDLGNKSGPRVDCYVLKVEKSFDFELVLNIFGMTKEELFKDVTSCKRLACCKIL